MKAFATTDIFAYDNLYKVFGNKHTILASRQPLVATVENVDDSSFDVAWSHSAPGVTRYIVSIKKTDSRDVPITQSTSGELRSLVNY